MAEKFFVVVVVLVWAAQGERQQSGTNTNLYTNDFQTCVSEFIICTLDITLNELKPMARSRRKRSQASA